MASGTTTPDDWLSVANREESFWGERVRALAPLARRELLDAADRLAEGAHAVRALDAYEALEADLDPSKAVDAARIRRLVEGRRGGVPLLEPLFVRTAAACVDPGLSLDAAAIVAQHAVHRGDVDTADRQYVALFARVRGRGDRAEAAAFVNFARFCMGTGREFEALAASRRAEALFTSLDQPWGMALARLHRSAVIQLLRDWVRLPAAIAAVEEMLPRLSEREASLLRISILDRRAHEAWSRGRIDDALRHVDEAEALSRASRSVPSAVADPRTGALLRVLAFVAGRRFDEAVFAADRALASGDARDARGMFLRCARLEARVALGRDGVENEARAILDDCVADRRKLSPGRRRECAASVAHALAALPPALHTMRRAFDVAATAAFERAIEVDRFARELPEAALLSPEDVETLSDHRRATLVEQSALGTAVALALERAAEDGRSPLPMFGDADGLTCVCAWCQRVRTKDGVWLTVQQFLPLRSAGPVQLTHGICESCAPSLAAQAAAAAP